MSLTMDSMSPADIAAVTGNNNNNDGFGGNNGWWIIILLLALGRGGWGNQGNGGYNQQPIVIEKGNGCGCSSCATQADLAAGFNNSAVLSNLNDLALGQAGIQQTLCQGFSGVNTALLQGFNGVGNAICNLGYNTQSGFNGISRQIADCCCDTRAAIKDVAYGNAVNTNAIQQQISSCCCDMEKMGMQTRFDAVQMNCNTLQAIDKLGDRIIDYMSNEKVQALRDENQALRLAASQSNQNAVLRAAIDASTAEIIRRTGNDCPIPAFVVQPPQPVTFTTNCCGQTQYANCGAC